MILMLAMLAVFYGIVIAILYVTAQTSRPSFDEYAVGGRSYGPWYVAMSYVNSWWPGATFTAFLGLAAGTGVFGLYGLAYSTLGVTFMYLMATRAWRWGARFGLRTQPDLLGMRYDSPTVKKLAAAIGVISMFPWVVLGMQALGSLFEIASDGAWSLTTCLVVGLVVIVVRQFWTVKMGMRGLVMTDMFQGFVAYVVAAVMCVIMLTGVGSSPISFADLGRVGEDVLRLPGDGGDYGPWYVFALIFTGVVGSLCWPTSFQRIYTAASVRSVKAGTVRTILISGVFYSLLMLIGIAGSSIPAVAADPQNAWFTLMGQFGGTWLLGLAVVVVFAASMGHIDGTVQVCGLQIANDIVAAGEHGRTDAQLTRIAKSSMIVFMALAGLVAYLTFSFDRLQLLAQISYQGIVQLSVPLFLGIFWRGGNKHGAIWGMVTGFVLAVAFTAIWPDDIRGLGSITGGIVAVAVNLVVFLVVSALTGTTAADKERVEEMFAAARRAPATRSTAPAGSPAVPAP